MGARVSGSSTVITPVLVIVVHGRLFDNIANSEQTMSSQLPDLIMLALVVN